MEEAEAAKLQLLENIVRHDLNPVEEARGFQRLLEEGMTKHELASSVGKPVGFVTMAVEMLSVRPDVLHLVESGTIPPLTAFQMSKLDHDRQGQVLRAMATQTISFPGRFPPLPAAGGRSGSVGDVPGCTRADRRGSARRQDV